MEARQQGPVERCCTRREQLLNTDQNTQTHVKRLKIIIMHRLQHNAATIAATSCRTGDRSSNPFADRRRYTNYINQKISLIYGAQTAIIMYVLLRMAASGWIDIKRKITRQQELQNSTTFKLQLTVPDTFQLIPQIKTKQCDIINTVHIGLSPPNVAL